MHSYPGPGTEKAHVREVVLLLLCLYLHRYISVTKCAENKLVYMRGLVNTLAYIHVLINKASTSYSDTVMKQKASATSHDE